LHDELKYKSYRKAFKKAEAVAESSYYKSMFDHKTNSTKRLGIT